MKRISSLLLVVVLVFTIMAGCGQTNEEGNIKIGLVTDTGGVNDQSFNQSAWEGLQRAEEELGIEVGYAESQQEADYGPNLEQLYDDGNDLIWGIGYMMADAILKAAQTNPDQDYAIIDTTYEDIPDNIVGVLFQSEQASFLVGYIAAQMTETDKVGFVGGQKGFIIDAFEYGYRAGVAYANKDVEVFVQYADSWTDQAKGKAITNQMYQNGADIVFHASGNVGGGVIESAKENDKYVIGVDKDQNYLAPDNVITSAMKRVDNAIFNIAEEIENGTFEGGKTITYGLAEGGVDIAPTSDKHVPEDILNEVEDLKQKIIDGEIVPPYNEETFNQYLTDLE